MEKKKCSIINRNKFLDSSLDETDLNYKPFFSKSKFNINIFKLIFIFYFKNFNKQLIVIISYRYIFLKSTGTLQLKAKNVYAGTLQQNAKNGVPVRKFAGTQESATYLDES